MFLSLRRNLLRNVGLCLGRNEILGTLVVCYSTGESSLSRGDENELLSSRAPGLTVICEDNKTDCYLVVLQVLQ